MRMLWLIAASVMLAGCFDAQSPDPEAGPGDGLGGSGDADTSSPAPGLAPQEGRAEDSNDHMSLVIQLEPCDAGYCIDAVATNEGLATLYVSDVCVAPYRDSMEKDGEAVEHREPTGNCDAFGTRAWESQEQIEFVLSWDGRLYDDASDWMVDAPEGAYQWSVHFRAYQEAEGGQPMDLEATVTVVIGET